MQTKLYTVFDGMFEVRGYGLKRSEVEVKYFAILAVQKVGMQTCALHASIAYRSYLRAGVKNNPRSA